MEKELEFYKKYHNNNINKWIHFFCIPMIILSIILLLNNFYITYESATKKRCIRQKYPLLLYYSI